MRNPKETGPCSSAFPASTALAAAQWLQFKTPGIPRTADGQPKLDAPAPRSADGHPDLSGVWMHVPTPVDEMRKLFGAQIDEAIRVDVPGMEIGTQNKYGLDLLLDFRANSPMRPEAAAFAKRRDDGSRIRLSWKRSVSTTGSPSTCSGIRAASSCD